MKVPLSAYAVTHVSKTLSLDAGAEKRQPAETGGGDGSVGKVLATQA